jgi:hypothetical protein
MDKVLEDAGNKRKTDERIVENGSSKSSNATVVLPCAYLAA